MLAALALSASLNVNMKRGQLQLAPHRAIVRKAAPVPGFQTATLAVVLKVAAPGAPVAAQAIMANHVVPLDHRWLQQPPVAQNRTFAINTKNHWETLRQGWHRVHHRQMKNPLTPHHPNPAAHAARTQKISVLHCHVRSSHRWPPHRLPKTRQNHLCAQNRTKMTAQCGFPS